METLLLLGVSLAIGCWSFRHGKRLGSQLAYQIGRRHGRPGQSHPKDGPSIAMNDLRASGLEGELAERGLSWRMRHGFVGRRSRRHPSPISGEIRCDCAALVMSCPGKPAVVEPSAVCGSAVTSSRMIRKRPS
jgi:hypothetical protein